MKEKKEEYEYCEEFGKRPCPLEAHGDICACIIASSEEVANNLIGESSYEQSNLCKYPEPCECGPFKGCLKPNEQSEIKKLKEAFEVEKKYNESVLKIANDKFSIAVEQIKQLESNLAKAWDEGYAECIRYASRAIKFPMPINPYSSSKLSEQSESQDEMWEKLLSDPDNYTGNSYDDSLSVDKLKPKFKLTRI